MQPTNKIKRRDFIKLSVAGSGFLAIGINFSAVTQAADLAMVMADESTGDESGFSPDVWIKIDKHNNCIITLPESELGQGVFTGLATLVAEELDMKWSQIKVERATSAKIYGHQITGGSKSIRKRGYAFRKAAAFARLMLVNAAADKWNISSQLCFTREAAVFNSENDKYLQFSDLINGANQQEIPSQVSLKSAENFKLIGKNIQRIDALGKVTGEAQFGIDVQLPDMLFATTLQPPVFGAKVGKINNRKAMLIDGVVKIFKIENAVAIVAENSWSAFKAAKILEVQWLEKTTLTDSVSINLGMQELLKESGVVAAEKGEVSSFSKLDKSQKIYSAIYSAPFQAHATMEPMNCSVHIHDGICEIWAPTQSPSSAKATAKKYYHSLTDRLWKKARSVLNANSIDDVIVHTTYAGGAFGRRLKQDFVAQAVQIAMHLSQPVKLTWSREQDMQHDFYRPAAFSQLDAQLNSDGYPLALSHHIVSPSLRESLSPGYLKKKQGMDSTAVEGAKNLSYDIDHHKVSYSYYKSPVPLGFWRSVGSSINAFHIECFIDELAALNNIDALEYRQELLQFSPRLLQTLKQVKKKSGWKKQADAYYGIACHSSYGSHVSQVVKLTRVDGHLRLDHIYCVIDCGFVINPDIVRSQLEGAIVFGLTSLSSQITLSSGRVEQSNYHDFTLLKFNKTPLISCEIINSSEDSGGVGEPGVPPAVPAVLNAIFAATGERIRDLPISSSILKF